MPKGWAAWPRSVRWLAGGIAAVVLALAAAWVLFVPTADWLARHDVGSVKGSLHETAVDNARGRLLTLGAGLFAAGALVFTARNFTLSRRAAELSRRTFELTEQGQVTDRYTKAIEQLGAGKLDVRIGGIYALERVARDSSRDHPTVMEVLTAFIREHSREPWPPSDHPPSRGQERSLRPDVQAALTVVGRRDPHRDVRRIDLGGADLAGADLRGAILRLADLRGAILRLADLRGADLTRVYLTGADLTGADLGVANLTGANLRDANLTEADLTGTILTGADLTAAHLRSADLSAADLDRADLTSADLSSACLRSAHLRSADLSSAILTGADLTDARLNDAILTSADLNDAILDRADLRGARLAGANLTDARWPSVAVKGGLVRLAEPIPEGWKLNTGSGRLERAAADSASPEGN